MRSEHLWLVPCLVACGIGVFAGRAPWLLRWAMLSGGLLGPLLVTAASINAFHVVACVGGAGLFLACSHVLNRLITSADRVSRTPRVR